MRALHAVLTLVVVVASCRGAEGPAGPQGATGPMGPAGPTGPQGLPAPGKLNYTIRLNSVGEAVQILPADLGADPSRPPSMTCWLAETNTSGVWIPVSDGFTSTNRTACGLVLDAGRWNAALLRGVPNWFVSFVITY